MNNAIITGMGLEPQDRPQTVREWLELLKPNPKSEIQNLKASKMDYIKITIIGKGVKLDNLDI